MVLCAWGGRLHRPRLIRATYSRHLLAALLFPPFLFPVVPGVLFRSMWFCGSWPHCLPVGVEYAKPIITFHPLDCSSCSQGQHMNWAGRAVIMGGLEQSYSLWHTYKSIWPQKLWAAILGLGIKLASGWSWQGEMERSQVFWISLRHWIKASSKTSLSLDLPVMWADIFSLLCYLLSTCVSTYFPFVKGISAPWKSY